jgi:hypothetical protein
MGRECMHWILTALPSKRGPLADFLLRYGLWASAPAFSGLAAGMFFPELPLLVILVGLCGLGIWLADINRRSRNRQGWIATALLGIFVAAAIFKWCYICGMLAAGRFEQISEAMRAISI